MQEVHVDLALPQEWLPEGAFVHVFARRLSSGHWETLLPEFTIAGMGSTLEGAAQNAIELLDDYLLVCARDPGLSFDDSRRPIKRALRWAVLRDIAGALPSLWRNRRQDVKSSVRYKVPLRLVGVS